jgi:hypothetical protein
MVPFLELPDGKTYLTGDGADEIVPGDDGKSLKVVYRRWSRIGEKSGERVPTGLTSTVEFRIDHNRLLRRETLNADRDVIVKRIRVAIPSTADRERTEINNGNSRVILNGREGVLAVKVTGDWTTSEVVATGDSRLGKGVLGPIPIHLVYEAKDLVFKAGESKVWELELELLK